MHDLDRGDLVFESDEFDESSRELDEASDELDDADHEAVFDEAEQAELAGDLLAVSDDHELDQFLGSLLKRVKSNPLARGLANQVGGYLKGAVKSALPTIAGLAGGAIGGPIGAALANKGAGALGALVGLELEGLSSEDQEFEVAKQLVRMSGEAIQNAANAAGTGPNAQIAKDAVVAAARKHAPGLLRGAAGERQQRGTWYRRGNRIVLVGV
jgi:hypothetical protein